MARFHHLRQRAVNAVDHIFAEQIRYFPLKRGATDPARAVEPFQAVLRTGSGEIVPAGAGRSWDAQIAPGKARLTIDRNQVMPDGEPLNLVARTGDKLRALERDGQPWWEVAHVDDRDDTRLVLHLTEA